MTNKKVAKRLNDLASSRYQVVIYSNGYNDIVVRGTMEDVSQVVKELLANGLQVISPMVAPDKTNPYDDGKYTAIVGKRENN